MSYQNSESFSGKLMIGTHASARFEIQGEGFNTTFLLRSAEEINIEELCGAALMGTLDDQYAITLLDTFDLRSGTTFNGPKCSYFARLGAHWLIKGLVHLPPNEPVVKSVQFSNDDLLALVHVPSVIGSSSLPATELAKYDETYRFRPHQEKVLVTYANPPEELLNVQLPFGSITCKADVNTLFGAPRYIRYSAKNIMGINFDPPVDFKKARKHTSDLLLLIDLLTGRTQKNYEFDLIAQSGEDIRKLSVIGLTKRTYDYDISHRLHLSPYDVLVGYSGDKENLSAIISAWFEMIETAREAVLRFLSAFGKYSKYDHDRLIGVANAFDILPEPFFSQKKELDPTFTEAMEQCKKVLKEIPECPGKSSVLGAIGRVGEMSLTSKICDRASRLKDLGPDRLPGMDTMISLAVNCRNHFVHGSKSRRNYASDANLMVHLTDCLEFIFGASILVDCGWDITQWAKGARRGKHPFNHFLNSYEEIRQALHIEN